MDISVVETVPGDELHTADLSEKNFWEESVKDMSARIDPRKLLSTRSTSLDVSAPRPRGLGVRARSGEKSKGEIRGVGGWDLIKGGALGREEGRSSLDIEAEGGDKPNPPRIRLPLGRLKLSSHVSLKSKLCIFVGVSLNTLSVSELSPVSLSRVSRIEFSISRPDSPMTRLSRFTVAVARTELVCGPHV